MLKTGTKQHLENLFQESCVLLNTNCVLIIFFNYYLGFKAHQDYFTLFEQPPDHLRRNLYSCPQEVKEAAYKGLVRPVLDYGSSVWDPPGVVLQEELESVQKRAARFVTGNYSYETGSMTGILGQLKWESLKKRRKDKSYIAI